VNDITNEELTGRLIAIRIQLEASKELYAEQDKIVLELKNRCIERFSVAGTEYSIVDNFAQTNVVFRPAGVKRFECVEVKRKKVA
jgi:hypothetical protein